MTRVRLATGGPHGEAFVELDQLVVVDQHAEVARPAGRAVLWVRLLRPRVLRSSSTITSSRWSQPRTSKAATDAAAEIADAVLQGDRLEGMSATEQDTPAAAGPIRHTGRPAGRPSASPAGPTPTASGDSCVPLGAQMALVRSIVGQGPWVLAGPQDGGERYGSSPRRSGVQVYWCASRVEVDG